MPCRIIRYIILSFALWTICLSVASVTTSAQEISVCGWIEAVPQPTLFVWGTDQVIRLDHLSDEDFLHYEQVIDLDPGYYRIFDPVFFPPSDVLVMRSFSRIEKVSVCESVPPRQTPTPTRTATRQPTTTPQPTSKKTPTATRAPTSPPSLRPNVTPSPTSTPVGHPPVPTGALKPGDNALATDTTRLRVGPSVTWRELQTVKPGTRMRILNGPVVADGYTWYSVSLSSSDSYAGWCADRSLRQETFDSRQIRFNVQGETFTRLKIVGQNQYGDTTVWEKRFTMGQRVMDTKNFWWRETLNLEFDVLNRGTRQCVIDSLHLTTTDQYQPVTYVEGQGCTGDDGSARSNQKYVEQLDEALSFAEASEIASILEKTDAGLGCLGKIAQGVGSKMKVITLTASCGSVAIDRVREILQEAHITLQILKGPVAYSLYCTNRYGTNAYAAYKNERDAKSWACFLGLTEVGSLDMDAACQLTSQARPRAVMGDRRQAVSWYCTP